ncbi:hypothetical protein [Clostridium botulinum]|uniref:hypothetical protein n=1 Tax=Clostridium botulinum TaxID=1491 RepID=UPI000773052E|nr:hypothetical protein [Clostridium botulinum]MBY6931004.1 hypothetical protein [Clostridium botulinum]NFG19910.1 hypothetical protein [Clostridium botulinum]NFO82212.1 hypothetical protein [Clostridium botulinum]
MDDHMLDRISDDINLCFMEAEYECSNKFNIKESSSWKVASILISTYNKLVDLYYKKDFKKGNIIQEYKKYRENM